MNWTNELYDHANMVQTRYLDAYKKHGSYRAAAKELDVNETTVARSIKATIKRYEDSKENFTPIYTPKEGETVVGIIGDTHIPYVEKGYLDFCKKTFKAYGVNKVVHIGDLIDNHSLSFHDSEPELKGAHGERYDAIEILKDWYEAFPEVTVIHGNHDRIPARQMSKIGLNPSIYMRPLAEVYQFPKGWEEKMSLDIGGVHYSHGESALGVNGFRNFSRAQMQCTVTGHAHGNFGVSYTATDSQLVWGMAVGCGVDVESMAFAYGKNFKLKPVIGCGIVIGGKMPIPVPMDLGSKIRRV